MLYIGFQAGGIFGILSEMRLSYEKSTEGHPFDCTGTTHDSVLVYSESLKVWNMFVSSLLCCSELALDVSRDGGKSDS